ncbi:MAG: transposase [Rhodobacteraceae bacterium]|jgi:putative transposase|nr:transposase [Paracoccaceae bacterium]
MIRKETTDLILTRQCKLFAISRSSIQYTPVGFNPATPELMHEIDRILKKYPFFGSRQMAAYLPQSGFSAGRYRVRRLMGIMGLQAIYNGPNTSKKHPEHRMYPYLLRKLPITQPNHAAQSGLVQRHHLHPGQKRFSVSGGDHGMGNAKTADLAALKYAGCSLLC